MINPGQLANEFFIVANATRNPGIVINNMHNRLGIIASDSIQTAFRRTRLLTSRNSGFVMKFVIEHLQRFSIFSEDPIEDFLEFWGESATTPTGAPQEFMINFLVEIGSIFAGQIFEIEQDVRKYLIRLFPAHEAMKMQSTEEGSQRDYFNRSYVFMETPVDKFIEKLTAPEFVWVTPWIILAHSSADIIEGLIEAISFGDDSTEKDNAGA